MMFQLKSCKYALLLGVSLVLAQTVEFAVPGGELKAALDAYARQAGIQLVYREDDVRGVATEGVRGALPKDEALEKILQGTDLVARRDASGAMAVVRNGSEDTALAVSSGSAGATRLAQADGVTGSARSASGSEESGSDGAVEKSAMTSENKEGTQLEEIVVTAQKRQERLQDVPVPVSAINAHALAESSQLRLQDYYNKVPGLALTTTGLAGVPAIVIRGITTGANSNPTVGVVIDDVSYGASVAGQVQPSTAPDIDPGELSRVEVLRGPQGTLYGASSMGGLLKFVTVDPSTRSLNGQVQVGGTSVSHGNDLGYSVRGAINVPIADTFAVRAGVFTTREPGYIDNAETGQHDVNRRENDGGRVSALWRPLENFSLKFSALIQDSKRLGTEDVDAALEGEPKQSFLQGTGLYDKKTQAYATSMSGKLSRLELTSITSYSIDEADGRLDTTRFAGGFLADEAQQYFQVDRGVTQLQSKATKFSQEIRASLAVGERTNWLLGAYYTDEDFDATLANIASAAAGDNVGLLFDTFTPLQLKEYAAFTNMTFELSDRADVQVGGRISKYRQVFSYIQHGPVIDEFFGVDPLIQPDKKANDSAFTYLVTPRFKLSPDLMIYTRFASGYRPGGSNANCGLAQTACEFGPDTTRNYELGLKGSAFDRALSFDASVYHIDWRDIQLDDILIDGFPITANGGRAKSQGMELSAESKPWSGMTLSGWVSYNEAKLTEDFPPGSFFGNAGDRLPYGSRFSGNLSLDQEFPLGNKLSALVGGSVSYVGDRKGGFKSTELRETFPAYTQIDLKTTLMYEDVWTLIAFVNNVSNKRGVLRGGLDAEFIPTYFTYIRPRTVGLSLSRTF